MGNLNNYLKHRIHGMMYDKKKIEKKPDDRDRLWSDGF